MLRVLVVVMLVVSLVGCERERFILDDISKNNPSYEGFAECIIPEEISTYRYLGEVHVAFDLPCLEVKYLFHKAMSVEDIIGETIEGELPVLEILRDDEDTSIMYLEVGYLRYHEPPLSPQSFSLLVVIPSDSVGLFQKGVKYDFELVVTGYDLMDLGEGKNKFVYRPIYASPQ